MAVKPGELESELIDAVSQAARQRVSDGKSGLAESFVRQYYRWVPAAELSGRSREDLLGAALSHLHQATVRSPGQTKVRVFNPDPERDGFSSPYTVIELVSEDMPFIVDSVNMELTRQGATIELAIHPVMWVRRDESGRLVEILEPESDQPDAGPESVMRAEVARETDPGRREQLEQCLRRVLAEVGGVVEDWQPMRSRALELAAELRRSPPEGLGATEIEQGAAFLEWMAADHFTFLGYAEYELGGDRAQATLQREPETGLGILRASSHHGAKTLRGRTAELAHTPYLLVLTKANSRSTVHRPAHLDYIGVKRLAPDGQVRGECRFLGLYATAAYRASPSEVPLLDRKVADILERAGFPPSSHDHKALLDILESYPRDWLLQISVDELFTIAMGLLRLGERPRVRLFAWVDPLERFVSCTVTIPRDRFNTESREGAGAILLESFGGQHLDYTLELSESVLVRVNYIVWAAHGVPEEYDLEAIERRIVRALRGWSGELGEALRDAHGEDRGTRLKLRYGEAFPPGYRSDSSTQVALADIAELERLEDSGGTSIRLYRPEGEPGAAVRCRLYSARAIALSDVLPTFEHMGARVMDERPYRITPSDGEPAWIYDFGLRTEAEDLEPVAEQFQEAFIGTQRGEFEDDGLAGLTLRARLRAREIVVLRAVARYLRQAGIPYSTAYMERTLNSHPDVAGLLVRLFVARFDPDGRDSERSQKLGAALEQAIDEVASLDEDRILRGFLSVVRAVVRTNYFRSASRGQPPPYVSFKLEPSELALLPRPRPKFEIFVYSPRFEGIHLRGGRVARGGIRWSERPEDFRSEILGLMKAQMVKNALIVPVGAKGGFVLKQARGSEADQRDEAVACYRLFLSGLLDLTDNIVDGETRVPDRVVRYDEDDTYLVVAADKGTASFSDIANEISEAHGYWLGDGFASGGSHGYDHKKMGITARGSWESVKRHFRELGTDIENSDFTAVAIGDMAGDVFGNAMLLSRHTKLLAAFNHRHVFLDPDPDANTSWAERKRLFELEGSTWMDYNQELISAGGGVYERSAKSIELSSQIKEALAIEADELSPPELIQGILRAPVDLFYGGGIGTYVKASAESHADAVDKANDLLRVDGRELRCRVVGEGGNLGFTQRGRVEYAQAGGPDGEGGHIYTDATDNVAGVNTSDHEVNIKILLDSLVRKGELTADERDRLLVEMTDFVAGQVLYDSYVQGQAISLTRRLAAGMIDVHGRLIRYLEQEGELDRELEQLPDEAEIAQRKSSGHGLTSPEISVLMAYYKIHLHASLLESDLPEDEYLGQDLERYFAEPLQRFKPGMASHRLRREIVASVVANELVDRADGTFAFRLGEETGAPDPLLARGLTVAREVFGLLSFWRQVEALDGRVDAEVQLDMLTEGRRLAERSTRALVRGNPVGIDIEASVRRFEPGVRLLEEELESLLGGSDLEAFATRRQELEEAGVPDKLARRVAAMPIQPAAFDVVIVAGEARHELAAATRAYFLLGSRLELNWLRERIVELPRENRWQTLARTALREELLGAQRGLTREVLEADGGGDAEQAMERWSSSHEAGVERLLQTLSDIRASRTYDTTTLAVALRELRALIGGQDRAAPA